MGATLRRWGPSLLRFGATRRWLCQGYPTDLTDEKWVLLGPVPPRGQVMDVGSGRVGGRRATGGKRVVAASMP